MIASAEIRTEDRLAVGVIHDGVSLQGGFSTCTVFEFDDMSSPSGRLFRVSGTRSSAASAQFRCAAAIMQGPESPHFHSRGSFMASTAAGAGLPCAREHEMTWSTNTSMFPIADALYHAQSSKTPLESTESACVEAAYLSLDYGRAPIGWKLQKWAQLPPLPSGDVSPAVAAVYATNELESNGYSRVQ